MSDNVTMLVFTDGRAEYIERTLKSAKNRIVGNIKQRVIIDDSADPKYQEWLRRTYLADYILIHSATRKGFAGAIQTGWGGLSQLLFKTDFVVHLEDDFIFKKEWDLAESISLLEHDKKIAQICLRRQPWGVEPADGGFIAQWPHLYVDQCWNGIDYLTHQNFFSTNPSIYPIRVTKYGWPDAPDSEGKFGPKLFAENYCCAFLGKRDDAPRVEHIGLERAGVGY